MTVAQDGHILSYMTRPEAARKYEAQTLTLTDGYRVRVLEVIESSGRFVTFYGQRINKDGSIRRGDEDGRHLSTIAHASVTA